MRVLTLTFLLAGCQPDFTEDDTGTSPAQLGDDTSDPSSSTTPLFINEFMASNASYTFDGGPEDSKNPYTPDWIELYNPGSTEVDLDGYTITDDLDVPDKHTLEELSIPAGGYLLLYADKNPELGVDHLDFKLSRAAEDIGLYTAGGDAVDLITYTDQVTDMAAARIPDGGTLQIVEAATPGSSNPSAID